MWILVHLVFPRKSLKLSFLCFSFHSFLLFLLFWLDGFHCPFFEFSDVFLSLSCLLFNTSIECFSSTVLFSSVLFCVYIIIVFAEIVTLFMHCFLDFSKHISDCYFEFLIRYVTYLYFVKVCCWSFIISLFGICSFSSFSLPFCAAFCALGKTVTFQSGQSGLVWEIILITQPGPSCVFLSRLCDHSNCLLCS